MAGTLEGKVCIVTGGTRGIGKGIALQLGEAGATVYVTGRTLTPKSSEYPGSLQETAEEIKKRGGKCIPVQCDHSDDNQIKDLFDKVRNEQDGRLDILINNVYSAVPMLFSSHQKKFWEMEPEVWDNVNVVGLRAHYIATVHASRMMVPRKQGLIVNISSVGGVMYFLSVPYGVGKAGCDKMATDCAKELKEHNIASISLWPGPVKTEVVVDNLTNGKFSTDMMLQAGFSQGESIEYAGKAIVHLANDPKLMQKTGRILWTCDLAREYNFKDIDGRDPPSYRHLKDILHSSGHTWLARLVPKFIRFPGWALAVQFHKF
ncbi:dehydrogenase/reductase SDR family member 1-like [Glandiceps talaboti]